MGIQLRWRTLPRLEAGGVRLVPQLWKSLQLLIILVGASEFPKVASAAAALVSSAFSLSEVWSKLLYEWSKCGQACTDHGHGKFNRAPIRYAHKSV